MDPNSFDAFSAAVKDSVDGQAKRKNYAREGLNGRNQLAEVGALLNFEPQHGIGEIVYKCSEYLANPREVLLVKIAGWAYILWKRSQEKPAPPE
jgi:hypothetical protein